MLSFLVVASEPTLRERVHVLTLGVFARFPYCHNVIGAVLIFVHKVRTLDFIVSLLLAKNVVEDYLVHLLSPFRYSSKVFADSHTSLAVHVTSVLLRAKSIAMYSA